jgi:hypothetical protein
MRPWLSSSIAAAVLLWGLRAHANPSARLVYVRAAGASECPNEDVVRRSVAARLGYDPFFLSAPTTIFVEVSRNGERFDAVVKLVDSQGVERGTRHLESNRDCANLVGTLALTISLVVDSVSLAVAPNPPSAVVAPDPPDAVAPAAPAAPPVSSPASLPPSEAPLPPTGRPSRNAPFFAGVTVLGTLGSALAPTAGAALFGGIRRGWASIRIEARGDLPASASTPPAARSWALFGWALPCGHLHVAFACAVMGVEWIHATGDARSPRHAETLVPVAGARLGVEVAATDRLAFAAYAELLAPLQRPRIEIDGVAVQHFPVVAGDVGVSALERF